MKIAVFVDDEKIQSLVAMRVEAICKSNLATFELYRGGGLAVVSGHGVFFSQLAEAPKMSVYQRMGRGERERPVAVRPTYTSDTWVTGLN